MELRACSFSLVVLCGCALSPSAEERFLGRLEVIERGTRSTEEAISSLEERLKEGGISSEAYSEARAELEKTLEALEEARTKTFEERSVARSELARERIEKGVEIAGEGLGWLSPLVVALFPALAGPLGLLRRFLKRGAA